MELRMTLVVSLATILGAAATIASVSFVWRDCRKQTYRVLRFGNNRFVLPANYVSSKTLEEVAEAAHVPVRSVLNEYTGAKSVSFAQAMATDIPPWVLGLMPPNDAQRYTSEWTAHLDQLIAEGEIRQARRDRRRLALAAITLAIALRVRRALGRAH
jgi:hypothetical protein